MGNRGLASLMLVFGTADFVLGDVAFPSIRGAKFPESPPWATAVVGLGAATTIILGGMCAFRYPKLGGALWKLLLAGVMFWLTWMCSFFGVELVFVVMGILLVLWSAAGFQRNDPGITEANKAGFVLTLVAAGVTMAALTQLVWTPNQREIREQRRRDRSPPSEVPRYAPSVVPSSAPKVSE
jgi:hypothetical protein